ncbi:hypothetical protein KC675_02760 [Candidatus Dojkabacteria bacterium]|jgi:hypothetical protein|uniref:Uncharacterized protein n=1 Tax=Candidatus Dojkabacteria bacterium TaxID=2099670 RepID=A0A955IB93_9BACT|nr:hypothetical protein [Candidatus Dojkabacteria bacterium]
MYFTEFVEFIKKWNKYGKYPPRSAWPEEIVLDRHLWEDIVRLHRFTDSTGYEYESSLFYIEKETIISKPLKGNKDNVHAHHSMQVKYVPDNKNYKYERQIILDSRIIQKDYFAPDQLPKQVDSGFLFNMHTHPTHLNNTGSKVYTFFSPTDINSLLKINTLLTGLITDEFWIACKTDQIISKIGEVGEEMLSNITRQSVDDETLLETVLKKEIQNWGLVIYRGDFNRTLKKII